MLSLVVMEKKKKKHTETDKERRKEEKWTLVHVLKCARNLTLKKISPLI